jgi:hypothetical protein
VETVQKVQVGQVVGVIDRDRVVRDDDVGVAREPQGSLHRAIEGGHDVALGRRHDLVREDGRRICCWQGIPALHGPHPAGRVQDDERLRAHAGAARAGRQAPCLRCRRSLPSREGSLALPDRREVG